MSCWARLPEAERECCFDAKSKPKRELIFKSIWKVKAWAVKGPLQEEWNQVLLIITQASAEHNFRERLLGKDQRNSVVALPKWSLYLVGRKPRADKLNPMIIAEHSDINIARRAYKAFDDLRDSSIGDLLRGYDFYYAQYTIRPRADAGNPMPSSPGPSNENLCGLHVVISSPGESTFAAGTTWTHSTIGGCIEINGEYYGLTAAHAFPDTTTGALASSHETDRSSSSTPKAGTGILQLRQVYAHPGIVDNPYGNALDTSAQLPGIRMLLNGDVTDLERNRVAPIHYNRDKDWALVPISNGRFATHNRVDLGSGQYMSVSGVAETVPDGPVYVASGVSQPSVTKLFGTASAMLLPGSDRLHIVWTAERGSDLGDCGSWVINEEGRPFGMIVAASEDEGEAETYCLPLAPIFADIQEEFKAPVVVPAAREPEADEPYSFQLRAHQSCEPKSDMRKDATESSDNSTSSGNTQPKISKIQKVDGYGTDYCPSKSTRLTANATQTPEKIKKALGPQKLSKAATSELSPTDISSKDMNRMPDSGRQRKKLVHTHTVETEEEQKPKPSNEILEKGGILSLVNDESRTSDHVKGPATALNVLELGGPKASDMHVEQDPEDRVSNPQDALTNAEKQLVRRTPTIELMKTASLAQGNEEHGRASSDSVIPKAREREAFEHVSRRPKSSLPEVEVNMEREGTYFRRNNEESPSYRGRTQGETISRPEKSKSSKCRKRYRWSDDIIIRRRSGSPPYRERSRERGEGSMALDDRTRTRERPEMIIRRDERDRSRRRSVSSDLSYEYIQKFESDNRGAELSYPSVYTIASDEDPDELEGVIEEARRKADRRAKRPVRRIFSRRYIDPETLNQHNVKWRWEDGDDWIVTKQDLTEEQETELRAHTKRLQQGQGRTSHKHDIHGDGTPKKKGADAKEVGIAIARLEKENNEKEAKLRMRMTKTGFSQNYIGARRSDELAIENACDQLDLQFESEVQDLLWEAGCPIDFCEQILEEHAAKEERKTQYTLWRQDRRPRGIETRARSTGSESPPEKYDRGMQPINVREHEYERRRPTVAKKDTPSMVELLTRSKPVAAVQT